ncbi:MAG TPA: hypothetical protein VKB80_25300 [Kofleriaceae bacterium]|nr:hypothetical protein [Kofleriaceae bacterium]
MRAAALAGIAALAAGAGCGSRCREIAAERDALARRAPAVGPHLQLQISLATANALIAETLRDEPLSAEIALPRSLPVAVPGGGLTAVAREVRLLPAGPDRVRAAIRLEIGDADGPITWLAVEAAIAPALVREAGGAQVVIGFGPRNLEHVRPELAPRAERALADAIGRRLPRAIRDRVPRALLERAGGRAASYLAGAAFDLLRAALLGRLGELTRLRVRLPDVPIRGASLQTRGDALEIDVATDLPVRRGLRAERRPPAAGAGGAAATDRADAATAGGASPTGGAADTAAALSLRVSGSAAAELANWAIERGRLPRRYTRSLEPRPDGQYVPRLDYLAGRSARPLVVHVFQERGGCSSFQVGLRPRLSVRRGRLVVDLLDQRIERVRGPAHLEIAVWLRQLVTRSVDHTRQLAAATEIAVGGRRFTARVVEAAIADGELRFALRVSRAPARRR